MSQTAATRHVKLARPIEALDLCQGFCEHEAPGSTHPPTHPHTHTQLTRLAAAMQHKEGSDRSCICTDAATACRRFLTTGSRQATAGEERLLRTKVCKGKPGDTLIFYSRPAQVLWCRTVCSLSIESKSFDAELSTIPGSCHCVGIWSKQCSANASNVRRAYQIPHGLRAGHLDPGPAQTLPCASLSRIYAHPVLEACCLQHSPARVNSVSIKLRYKL